MARTAADWHRFCRWDVLQFVEFSEGVRSVKPSLLLKTAGPALVTSLLLLALGAGAGWYVDSLQSEVSGLTSRNIAATRHSEELLLALRDVRLRLLRYLNSRSRSTRKKPNDCCVNWPNGCGGTNLCRCSAACRRRPTGCSVNWRKSCGDRRPTNAARTSGNSSTVCWLR